MERAARLITALVVQTHMLEWFVDSLHVMAYLQVQHLCVAVAVAHVLRTTIARFAFRTTNSIFFSAKKGIQVCVANLKSVNTTRILHATIP